MKHETQVQLIRKVLELEAQGSTDMDETESRIPVQDYLDPIRFERELKEIIRGQPILVARSSQLKNPGDFITHNDSGIPILIVRTQDGHVQAFLNVCRHRGTKLVTEKQGQQAKGFVCSYHAWSYGLDGKLKGIPHKQGFPNVDKSNSGLVELPIDEMYGFIWVIPKPGANLNMEQFLGPLAEDFEALDFQSHVLYDERRFERPINWKLSIDTFLENYHVRQAHKTTIDHFFLNNVGIFEQFGLHIRNVYPKKTITSLKGTDPSTWNIREHANLVYCIFPNTLILVEPDHMAISTVFPDGLQDSVLFGYTLLPEPPQTDKAKRYWDKNNEILYNALEEDFLLASRVQESLVSGANEYLVHGRYEKGLKFYHQTVDKLLHIQSYQGKVGHAANSYVRPAL